MLHVQPAKASRIAMTETAGTIVTPRFARRTSVPGWTSRSLPAPTLSSICSNLFWEGRPDMG
ncbi:MAG: hypothetical protein PHC67_00425 [Methanoculleus sp.]|nr:hypothetical protein [Methanoculleus sp.]HOI57677.1 hypothetical protein [Methanoculleus sp.]